MRQWAKHKWVLLGTICEGPWHVTTALFYYSDTSHLPAASAGCYVLELPLLHNFFLFLIRVADFWAERI